MIRRKDAPGNAPGEEIVRAALAEYRRRLSAFRWGFMGLVPLNGPDRLTQDRDALGMAEEILGLAVHQCFGYAPREATAEPVAVEVDGALIVLDPRDGDDEGTRVHVVEASNLLRLGPPDRRRDGETSRVTKNDKTGDRPEKPRRAEADRVTNLGNSTASPVKPRRAARGRAGRLVDAEGRADG